MERKCGTRRPTSVPLEWLCSTFRVPIPWCSTMAHLYHLFHFAPRALAMVLWIGCWFFVLIILILITETSILRMADKMLGIWSWNKGQFGLWLQECLAAFVFSPSLFLFFLPKPSMSMKELRSDEHEMIFSFPHFFLCVFPSLFFYFPRPQTGKGKDVPISNGMTDQQIQQQIRQQSIANKSPGNPNTILALRAPDRPNRPALI